MGNKNTVMGGTNWADGDILYAADLNNTFDRATTYFAKTYSDNTGGSVSASVTETDVATLTIGAGALGSSATLIINSNYRFQNGSASSNTGTVKLYVNGSAVKTISVNNSTTFVSTGSGITYRATSLDNTSSVVVKVTIQHTVNDGAVIGYCEGLTVEGYENQLS